MRKKIPKQGLVFQLTNHLTYFQKYALVCVLRGFGFFILLFFFYSLIHQKLLVIHTKMDVNTTQMALQKQFGDAINRGLSLEQLDAIKHQIHVVGEKGQLELTPLESSYLYLENALQILRESQFQSTRALQLIDRLNHQGEITREVKAELALITNSLKKNEGNILKAFDKVKRQIHLIDGFLDVEIQLNSAFYQYQTAVEEFSRRVNERYIKDNLPISNSSDADLSVMDVMSTSFVLWDLISKELKQLLDLQIESLWEKMISVMLIAFAFIFAGSWLGVHFVYEALNSFRDLDRGTRLLTSGDMKVRVPVVYCDEIGRAIQAFNKMADHFEKLMIYQQELMKATNRLSKGDFSARIHLFDEVDDDLKEVFISFNDMAHSFEEILNRFHHLGLDLTSSVVEMTTTSKRQEDLIIKQSESTHEISMTASEISKTAQKFAIDIKDVGHIAQETSQLASAGLESLVCMEKVMNQMVKASNQIGLKLQNLNQKSQSITAVVTTIDKVADQTNLLSLNAAIEAEKTGEFRRRFSGIAGEIRRLSDQTTVASHDIKKIVAEIIEAISLCVREVDSFKDRTCFWVQHARKVSEQLRKIIVQVQVLNLNFELVNTGMQTQSQSVEALHEAMVVLSQLAAETAGSIEQFRTTIQRLDTVSTNVSASLMSDRRVD